jgi:membrane-bound ClpP family serine protease
LIALGLLLLAAGGGLLVAEAHVPTNGVFGIAGVAGIGAGIALTLSGLGAGAAVAVVVAVIAGLAAVSALVLALPRVGATRRTRIRSGAEGMIGHIGTVRRAPQLNGEGRVFVDGALWHACPDPRDEKLEEGDRVVVEGVTGLTLSVRKAEEWEVPR